jgi:hypothetical protein
VAPFFEILEAVVAGGSWGEEAYFAGTGVGVTPVDDLCVVVGEENGIHVLECVGRLVVDAVVYPTAGLANKNDVVDVGSGWGGEDEVLLE